MNTTQKTILANTFTPMYDNIEDRLRVVINYDDLKNRVDLMITRGFILNLIPSIDDYIFQYYEIEVEIETEDKQPIQNENNKSSKNKQTISKTDNTNLNLYKQDDELLLKVDLTYLKESKQTLIVFSSKETIVKSQLDSEMFQQIIKIIKSNIPYMKWGISKYF
ncbi:MAG: hypothetical protein U9Q20_03425 [Campylobacterota bacterium]|nr:hypothetical protein [Campylobacterota bacterium]